MEDTNIIKATDKVINLIIIGVIIQFLIIVSGSLGSSDLKLYSAKLNGSSIFSSTENKENELLSINFDNELVKNKLNGYTDDFLKNKNKEDIIVIKVKTPEKTVVETASEQIKEVEKEVLPPVKNEKESKKEQINIPSVWHTVQRGENLTKIAELYDISLSDLREINSLSGDTIYKGQRLKITKVEGVNYKVQSGDSLWVIAQKYHTSIDTLMTANAISDYSISPGEELRVYPGEKWFLARKEENSKRFIWPLNNQITSPFGSRIHPVYNRNVFHNGVDIRGNVGEPIKAAGDGKVTFAGENGGYGNVIMVEHTGGYETRYAHCSKLLVRKGERVKRGQKIGRVGSTGVSTGPHLHFEIRKNNKAVNPMEYR
ncbi:MAG: peptidoglycan DD-metalloendopeptidase family protein [Candidatus Muiribacteriota bacterium]